MNNKMPKQTLKRLKIAFISQPEYFSFIYEEALSDNVNYKEFVFHFSNDENDLSDLQNFDAHINIFFRGEYIPNKILENLNGLKINLSSEPFPRLLDGHWDYSLDSIRRYFHFRKIRNKQFDYLFHYDASSIDLFKKDGLNISGEFAFPVSTNLYTRIDEEKQWDIFFIGRSTKYREKHFLPLKHQYKFLHIAHGIWGRELIYFINSSKICLNVHTENKVSWEPRIQMLLSCGAFVISEEITPNRYLRPGIDYIEAANQTEMLSMASYYLENKEERLKIANNGYYRIREVLSSKSIFPIFINDLYRGKYPKYFAGKGNLLMNVLYALFLLCVVLKKYFMKYKVKYLKKTILNVYKNI